MSSAAAHFASQNDVADERTSPRACSPLSADCAVHIVGHCVAGQNCGETDLHRVQELRLVSRAWQQACDRGALQSAITVRAALNAILFAFSYGNVEFPARLMTPALNDRFSFEEVETLLVSLMRARSETRIVKTALDILGYRTVDLESDPDALMIIAKYAPDDIFSWFVAEYKVTPDIISYWRVVDNLRDHFKHYNYEAGRLLRVVALLDCSDGFRVDGRAEDSILAALSMACRYRDWDSLQAIAKTAKLTRATVKRRAVEYVRAAAKGNDKMLGWFLAEYF